MTVYVHDSQFFTRRGAVLVVIIGVHVFIAWALATGLARRVMEVIAPPIQTDIVEERKPHDLSVGSASRSRTQRGRPHRAGSRACCTRPIVHARLNPPSLRVFLCNAGL